MDDYDPFSVSAPLKHSPFSSNVSTYLGAVQKINQVYTNFHEKLPVSKK